jgi:PAS domain S-box-containing protein
MIPLEKNRETWQELRDTFGQIFEHVFDAVIVFKGDGSIIFHNPAALLLFGYTAETFNGTTLEKLIPTYAEYLRNHAHTLNDSPVFEPGEIELTKKDGSQLIVLLRLFKASAVEWVAILHDKTLAKKVKNELYHKTSKLENINYQMEQFLYSASHELRAPATTILGLANLLTLETSNKTILDYTEKIKNTAEKLELITRDLVGFARISYSRKQVKKIDLVQAFQETTQAVSVAFPTVAFRTNISVKGDYPFYSNPDRIKIILENLVKNSFQFFDFNKSELTLSLLIELEAECTKLELTDNGIGIGKIHQDKIFRIFYKATERAHGAGLGLFIVKEALLELKGDITVESEIGMGTRICLRIPNGHMGRLKSRKLQLSQHQHKQ